jgi:hypothetical protein
MFYINNNDPIGTFPYEIILTRRANLKTIDLNNYFSDPDGDILQYEIMYYSLNNPNFYIIDNILNIHTP